MTVREEVRERIERDALLAKLRQKIERGKASYTDTAAYSVRAGKLLGEIFSRRLPEIPPEEREQLCVDLLHDQYIDINAAVDTAQRFMDEAQGLHLAPQHAPFDSARGHQIGSALRDLSKPVEVLQRRAKAAPETAVKAMHDDRMKSEAKFRHSAGLDCRITRVAVNGCCAWCSKVAGRFAYGEEPDDIYRRHDNCDCTVTFENGRKRQDVWSKQEWEAPEEDAGAGEPVVFTAEQAAAAGAGEPVRYNRSQSAASSERLTNDSKSGRIESKTYTPATQQEIQQFVADMQTLGFASVTGFENFTERASLLQEIAEDFGVLHKSFPEVFSTLHLYYGYTETLSEDVYAEYTPSLRRIALNPFFYNDLNFLKAAYEDDIHKNHHPPGTNYRANIPHEFGHAVEDYYGINNKAIVRELFEQEHAGIYPHYTRKLANEWVRRNLSAYAMDGHFDDFISESFAEYSNSDHPRYLCKQVFNYVLKRRGES